MIEHARGRYRLGVARGLVVDIQAFRSAGRRVRLGTTEEVRRAARAEALAWWRGDFCADEQFGGWADDQRDQLRAEYLALLLEHAEDLLSAQQVPEALATFQRALQEDSFWDAALRGVVRSLLALGQRGEAQLRVQRYRERHMAELGGDVADETKRFLASVLGLER
ncbi:bacterial transcriptional activator domain-containing protein [Gemmatimonas sp.]|uniref:AfsR/SARP family transcriptional regulator n=1 Tax=Gemmatimonas sp. TaxID=1962908 RepID=UPI00286DC74C|nr:bacterial transcriptional activator domain-containing protein [Gemmatimonas sp.]